MKYTIVYTRRFTKSLKRVRQFKGFKADKLATVLQLLSEGQKLPEHFRDHALSGDVAGYRECHIAPDILLIYTIRNDVLICSLTDIGNHGQLF
jgi:mRNA interferase YafQ